MARQEDYRDWIWSDSLCMCGSRCCTEQRLKQDEVCCVGQRLFGFQLEDSYKTVCPGDKTVGHDDRTLARHQGAGIDYKDGDHCGHRVVPNRDGLCGDDSIDHVGRWIRRCQEDSSHGGTSLAYLKER